MPKEKKIKIEHNDSQNGGESPDEERLSEERDNSASVDSPDIDEPKAPETAAEIIESKSADATISSGEESDETGESADTNALLSRMTENWQRERASFLNYKRRVEEEKDKLRKYACFDLAFDLLKVLDYFESSISFGENLPEEAKSVIIGVEYTLRELTQVLSAHGIKPIEAEVGDEYDSSVMEAVERSEAPDQEPGTVLEVQRKGWRLYDRVLRPAQVVVATGRVYDEDEPGEEGGEDKTGSEEQEGT